MGPQDSPELADGSIREPCLAQRDSELGADVVESRALKTLRPDGVRTLNVKSTMGEAFACASMAQVVQLARELEGLGVACSFDRRGDVSAVALRKA